MHTIEATYRIVTPMFIGDAEQKATGIRPPSVKGALRFWWRALAWPRFRVDADGDEVQALRDLHATEARLFGLAGKIEKNVQTGGQGAFLLRVDEIEKPDQKMLTALSGHQYLLGQGLYHFRDKYLRTALTQGRFKVRVLVNPLRVKPGDVRSLLLALRAFGLLGGLGSRSRKGLGSVALVDLRQQGGDSEEIDRLMTVPVTLVQLGKAIQELLPLHLDDAEPPFTAFSKRARIVGVPSNDLAWQALDAYGKEMMRYRSWGQNGKVMDEPAERNFRDDHDLALKITTKSVVEQHPLRAVFGLPHNYFFSSTKEKSEMGPVHFVNGKWKAEGRSRRASPLLVHAHDFPNGGSVIVTTVLPARFLPEGDMIEMSTRGFSCRVEPNPEWEVLHQFLDRFENRQEWLGK